MKVPDRVNTEVSVYGVPLYPPQSVQQQRIPYAS